MDSEPPIAHRRPRRSLGGSSITVSAHTSITSASTTTTKTPRKPKRVRFSEPAPCVATPSSRTPSTGLTPMVRRAAISSSRRHSAPASTIPSSPVPAARNSARRHDESVEVINIRPLRQVIEGRVQRRLRRSGLSEEMNSIMGEKRQYAREVRGEIETLREELRQRDDEIYRLQNETVVIDTDRIWGLETQVKDLRRQLSLASAAKIAAEAESSAAAAATTANTIIPSSPCGFDWTMAARDPYSDDFDMDHPDTTIINTDDEDDNDHFGDTTIRDELMCSTPLRQAANGTVGASIVTASFITPPPTSPQRPMTPPTAKLLAVTTKTALYTNAAIQTCSFDSTSEKQALREELASLQLEMGKLTQTLESYTSLTTRISERLVKALPQPPQPTENNSSPAEKVEAHLDTIITLLSDQTTAVCDITGALSSLGFPGADASEIILSLASGFRAARLELEYLTPGEITLPLSSHGAEVLDLVLVRLRELARQTREDEATIDEYHEQEFVLREQLSARVSAMDHLNNELLGAQKLLKDKNIRLQELEISVDRLKHAVAGYVRDVGELEQLVEQVDRESHEAAMEHYAQRQAAQDDLDQKDAELADLDTKLSAALARQDGLLKELETARTRDAEDRRETHKQHGAALALRDARVAELRRELQRITDSLVNAQQTMHNLRSENSSLESRLRTHRAQAAKTVQAMKQELEAVARISDGLLDTPRKSGAGTKRRSAEALGEGVLAAGPARRASGDNSSSSNKRRRYDSGVGMMEGEEEEEAPLASSR